MWRGGDPREWHGRTWGVWRPSDGPRCSNAPDAGQAGQGGSGGQQRSPSERGGEWGGREAPPEKKANRGRGGGGGSHPTRGATVQRGYHAPLTHPRRAHAEGWRGAARKGGEPNLPEGAVGGAGGQQQLLSTPVPRRGKMNGAVLARVCAVRGGQERVPHVCHPTTAADHHHPEPPLLPSPTTTTACRHQRQCSQPSSHPATRSSLEEEMAAAEAQQQL